MPGSTLTIAVAGATGVVGGHVVDVARARGHDVIPLARSLGVDLTTGAGLDDALDGADAVVDVTSTVTQKASAAQEFFGSITRTLLAAEESAGVGHHLALSIVGVDDVPSGYYAGKMLQERLVTQAPVPWSLLRATQFHEFAEQAPSFVKLGPFCLVPRMATQTVAAADVAAALVDLVEAGPSGRAPDLAGPEQNQLVDLARRVASARGLRRRVVGVTMPGAAGLAMTGGRLRPQSPGRTGTITFDDWISPT